MTDNITDTSAIFKFQLNKYFFNDINKTECFTFNKMKDGGDIYRVLLLEKCASVDSIYTTLLDSYHCIKHDTSGNILFDSDAFSEINFTNYSPEIYFIYSDYHKIGDSQVMGFDISLKDEMFTITLDSNPYPTKAAIIYNDTTKYMLAYAILSDNLELHNYTHIPISGTLTSISEIQ